MIGDDDHPKDVSGATGTTPEQWEPPLATSLLRGMAVLGQVLYGITVLLVALTFVYPHCVVTGPNTGFFCLPPQLLLGFITGGFTIFIMAIVAILALVAGILYGGRSWLLTFSLLIAFLTAGGVLLSEAPTNDRVVEFTDAQAFGVLIVEAVGMLVLAFLTIVFANRMRSPPPAHTS